MLTGTDTTTTERVSTEPSNGPNVTSRSSSTGSGSSPVQTRLERVLRIEWLGQTIASICWIGSVFAYEISSIGDWLQLIAASAWLFANVAVAVSVKTD